MVRNAVEGKLMQLAFTSTKEPKYFGPHKKEGGGTTYEPVASFDRKATSQKGTYDLVVIIKSSGGRFLPLRQKY